MTSSIVGIGYCGWDHLCVLPSIPLDDKVNILTRIEQGGGPAATAIFAAQKIGLNCAFMSVVGNDASGQQIIDALNVIGVDTHAMVRRDAPSPIAYCWIEEKTGKRSIAWTSGSCAPLTVEEVDFNLIANAKLLHLDGHQTAAAIAAAKFAREHGVLVSIDAGTPVPRIDELLDLCDIVIMSEKFAKNYAQEEDPVAASRKLFKKGITKFCGVTVGAGGSYGFDGTKDYFQKSFKVDVVDTTGAGDVYHGSFANAVVNGLGWQDCMRQATMTSALKCTKLGGRTGIPDGDTLRKALAQAD